MMLKKLRKWVKENCPSPIAPLVIKYTGENPVACLWDEAKIKKRRKSRFLIYEKFSCTDISYL